MFFSMAPVLLVFLLIAVYSIKTMHKGLTLPVEVRGHAGVCGECFYPVARGHRQICPECGRPYAEAGILTPALSLRMRPPAGTVILAWTLLVVLTLGIGSSVIGLAADESVALISEAAARILVWGLLAILLIVHPAGIVWITRRRRIVFAPPATHAEA